MPDIRVAIIGDIHAGLAATAKDLCPQPPADKCTDLSIYNGKHDDDYAAKFADFLSENDIQSDYMLLSGDLTNSAQPDEIHIVSTLIEKISNALDVRNDNIVFVPGNHDVNWKLLDTPDSTGIYWSERYGPFLKDRFQFQSILNNADGDGHVFENPFFSTWSYDDLFIVGYNSAHHDDPDQALHYGLVDPNHLSALDAHLDSSAISSNKICILLVHHHPIPYSDPSPRIPDFSGMVNSEHLMELLVKYHFDFVVHGHKHWPRFQTYSRDGAKPIGILCTGSFSVELDSRWAGTIRNQFHLVTFEDKDEVDDMAKGRVESWSYSYIRGWEKSDHKTSGIPHIEAFGTYLLPSRLEERLRPIIDERFHEVDYIEWSSIVEIAQELKHMRTNRIIEVLDSMAASLNYERQGETPESIILLKRI